jgi:hypothetical protein
LTIGFTFPSCTLPAKNHQALTRPDRAYSAIYRPRARRKIYINAVKNLGSHVPKSYRAPEELRMFRELLGESGAVITRDGRIGARFPSAGLLHLA